jgi:hypothetical protein
MTARPRDFLATSAFAASACAVRGLEHAFTMALRPQVPAVCSLHLPGRGAWAWLGVGAVAEASRAFADFDGLHLRGFPRRAQIVQVPCVYQFHHSGMTWNVKPYTTFPPHLARDGSMTAGGAFDELPRERRKAIGDACVSMARQRARINRLERSRVR